MMKPKIKICKMTFCPDPDLIWKLRIDSAGDECCDALTEATSKLGPHAKRSLARRIETDNPKVEAFLESIGLRPQTDKSG